MPQLHMPLKLSVERVDRLRRTFFNLSLESFNTRAIEVEGTSEDIYTYSLVPVDKPLAIFSSSQSELIFHRWPRWTGHTELEVRKNGEPVKIDDIYVDFIPDCRFENSPIDIRIRPHGSKLIVHWEFILENTLVDYPKDTRLNFLLTFEEVK